MKKIEDEQMRHLMLYIILDEGINQDKKLMKNYKNFMFFFYTNINFTAFIGRHGYDKASSILLCT